MVVFFSKFSQNLCHAPLYQNAQSARINAQFSTHDMKDPLQQKQTMQLISGRVLFARFYDVPNLPLQKQDFSCFVGPKWYLLETLNQTSENKTNLDFGISNFWSKFHQNRPTHIFNLWNTFSDNDSSWGLTFATKYQRFFNAKF